MGAQSRCTSTTKSPLVVTNLVWNVAGALATNAFGFSSGLGRGAAGAPVLVAGAAAFLAAGAAVFGADLAGGGVWARSADPAIARMSRAFIRPDYNQCAIPDASAGLLPVCYEDSGFGSSDRGLRPAAGATEARVVRGIRDFGRKNYGAAVRE